MADLIYDTVAGVENTVEFKNYVKVVFPGPDGTERHVTVTHEGVFTDIVKDGMIVDGDHCTHEDLFEVET